MNRDGSRLTAPSPRLVVFGVLAANGGWAVLLPWLLARPPSPVLAVGYAVALAGFGLVVGLVLRATVTPGESPATRGRLVALLVVVSLALLPAASAWAEPGQEPWAWLAGFVIGMMPLAIARTGALAVGAGLLATTALGAAVFHGSVARAIVIALSGAVIMWLMCHVLVWLLRLLWAAEAGRAAEAGLALAQERLRMSRELHDVLGHRLGIIALKAELAADLAAADPVRSAAESEEIRVIAATTLAEARRAVHGETVADLADQVAAAELVLGSAGIESTVDIDTERVPADASRLLAAVVREAVTNVLRHSDARSVSIGFGGTAGCPILTIVNDGVRPSAGGAEGSGTGLAALAARCAAAGARLVSGPADGGRFLVTVELAPDGVGPR